MKNTDSITELNYIYGPSTTLMLQTATIPCTSLFGPSAHLQESSGSEALPSFPLLVP